MNRIGVKFGVVMAAIIWPVSGLAGPCDAHFTFDRTLADASGNGYDGEMIDAQGGPAAAAFTDGRFGQALQLDGTGAMRALLDLNYDACPQVTFSAWIRVGRAAPTSTMHVLSTGRGSGPGLRVSDTVLVLSGTDNGIGQPDAIRRGSNWLFVAGVYDYEAGYYTLYWQGRHATEELSANRKPPETAFWIGTWYDEFGELASGVAIDELDIVGSALNNDQLTVLRMRSAGTSGGGTTLDEINQELTDRNAARSGGIDYEAPPDLTTQSGSGGSGARETNIDYEPPPDLLQSSGSGAAETTDTPAPEAENAPTPSRLMPGPVGEPVLSGISGAPGTIHRSVELDRGFITTIFWGESSSSPCRLSVSGWQPADRPEGYMPVTGEALRLGQDCGGSFPFSVKLDGETDAVGRIQACFTDPLDLAFRMKGIRIWGDRIHADGSTSYIPDGDSRTLPNCETWSPSVLCPIGTQATGVVVHAAEAGGVSEKIVGLQLICRAIAAPGT